MRYRVKDPQGQTHIIDGPEDATPDEVIAQAQKLVPTQKMGGTPPLGFIAKQVFNALPQTPMIKGMIQNPQTMLPMAGMALGSALGPGGAAAGAGLGQIGSRMIDIKKGSPVQSPMREAVGPMVQAGLAGLPDVAGFVPKWLGGNPGKTTLAQGIGKGLAKAGETMSGAKADILKQGFEQGLGTYRAPSLQTAQEIFGKAVGPEGEQALKQTAKEAFDPALGKARDFAVEIGTKIEQSKPVTALEALKARQATDRVISATPFWDKQTRRALYDWRTQFDEVMTSQSGALKNASTQYRKAIVKDTLLSPTRLTKHGAPSAFLPMLMGAAGPVMGASGGHTGKGALGALGGLAATSPMAWGLGATALGSINPVMAQSILAGLIQKAMQRNANPNSQ